MWSTLVLLNGNIYTMDKRNRVVDAVAISGSRIQFIGSSREVQQFIGPHTRVIDLSGRTVIPGLIDTHIHFVSSALGCLDIDLKGTHSLHEVQSLIKQRLKQVYPDQWIIGHGWNQNLWSSSASPTKKDLDALSTTHPILVKSVDGHTVWVNTLALLTASITRKTLNPPGGVIEREEETGEPTGILRETAIQVLESHIPPPPITVVDEAIKKMIQRAHAFGITSVHVPEDSKAFQAFQRLLAAQSLKIRVYMILQVDALDSIIALGLFTGFGNEKLKFGAIKVFVDGALGSQTAAMIDPYENDPHNIGILVTPKHVLQEILEQAYTHNVEVATHAIGDRANHLILDVIEHVASNVANTHQRFRIEHAQHLITRDIHRFGRKTIIACMQPVHISLDMDVADQYLGQRSTNAYRLRSLRDNKAILAFGSDSPVMTLDPFKGIYAAVTRKKIDKLSNTSWHPEERILVHDAVQAYTINAAYASGEEDIKGSIEPGKLADLVILSQNIFQLQGEALLDIKVDMTIFDGEIVYEKQTH